MTLTGALLLAFVLTAAADALAADADAEQAFEAATRDFEHGDYMQALEHFRRAREAGMETVAVAYNIGVCQYRTGDYEGAGATFRSIARRYPDMRFLAEYNLGLALVKQGEMKKARRAFEEAALADDPTLASLANAMLSRLARHAREGTDSSTRSRYGYIDLGIGYDDNVALLEDSAIATGRTTDSGFTEFFGQISGGAGIAGNPTLDASLYLVRYPDAGEFDQNVIRLGGRWRLPAGEWRLEAGPHYSYSTLDDDGFDQRLGATIAARRYLDNGHRLEMRLVHEEIDALESQFAFVDGRHQLADVRYVFQFDRKRTYVGYKFIIDDRAGSLISGRRHRLIVGHRRRIDDDWTIGADVSYRMSRFDELDLTRDEKLGEVRLALTRDITASWQLSGEYRWSRNDSNIDGFGYDRNRITLSLDRAF